VNVDFNSLDVIVNVESWVVILDFFGLGPDSPRGRQHKTSAPWQPAPPDNTLADKGNIRTKTD
jgi:hypothetical protein